MPVESESALPQLLVLSARTLRALEDATQRLVNHLKANPGLSLADVPPRTAGLLPVPNSGFAATALPSTGFVSTFALPSVNNPGCAVPPEAEVPKEPCGKDLVN